MAKKIFTVGDLPVFIEAESVEEALLILGDALDEIIETGPDLVYEIESEIIEVKAEKSKLN